MNNDLELAKLNALNTIVAQLYAIEEKVDVDSKKLVIHKGLKNSLNELCVYFNDIRLGEK